ncbi:hypothetical protein, partial [Aeromonas jandaei]|uniref:hypothetical protein n=1 Tax=Aeromonas jandaei TaxID=650 RepID=UPI002B05B57B
NNIWVSSKTGLSSLRSSGMCKKSFVLTISKWTVFKIFQVAKMKKVEKNCRDVFFELKDETTGCLNL